MKAKIKKIASAVLLATVMGFAYLENSHEAQANSGETCFFSLADGCTKTGNTMCTSCDPVIVTPN
ncbi:MAG: hypothetical protein MUC97_05895 [Bernardetiaceae bacterium]|nr:hypothetical protein [Bernardetiaceae bacterium]